jgi:hypothetical protein
MIGHGDRSEDGSGAPQGRDTRRLSCVNFASKAPRISDWVVAIGKGAVKYG